MTEPTTIWIDWIPGPAQPRRDTLAVYTNFTAEHAADMPGIVAAGLELGRAWPSLSGALGVWLWARPWERRCGSVSAWLDGDGLEQFMVLPAHVAIMNAYRGRGVIRSQRWTMEPFDRAGLREQGAAWVEGRGQDDRATATPRRIPG